MADVIEATIFKKPSIGGINISVSISETYAHEAQVPEHPVESGSSIGDHIQISPVAISMEGIITDVTSSDSDEADDTVEMAYSRLRALFEKRELFDLNTGLGGIRKNMALKSLRVRRDKETGLALGFSADLKQVRLVGASVVFVKDDAKTKTGKTKALGQKPTEEAPQAAYQSSKSVIKIFKDRITGANLRPGGEDFVGP